MVSAKENPNINDVNRPQPISIKAPPNCYQDGSTFRQTKVDCILCDHFIDCRKTKKLV
ncbi:MAG: hypothetical protein ACTSO9_01645 [Candidatus Helarchaeota archaeon]